MSISEEKKNIVGVSVTIESKDKVLEKIKKYISQPKHFFHIVSLNPENLGIANEDAEFKGIVETAQIQIVDGMGVATAAKMLGMGQMDRIPGVDLMETLMDWAGKERSTTMLIGGFGNLAPELADCYNRIYGQANYIGIQGIKNIKNPTKEERDTIFSIVAARRPRFIFVAFGSPWQEKWLNEHRALLEGIVCMGVGGAFDYLSGRVSRPPQVVRALGLEWLYRLVRQPWRWRRQLRLIKFMGLVAKQLVKSS